MWTSLFVDSRRLSKSLVIYFTVASENFCFLKTPVSLQSIFQTSSAIDLLVQTELTYVVKS